LAMSLTDAVDRALASKREEEVFSTTISSAYHSQVRSSFFRRTQQHNGEDHCETHVENRMDLLHVKPAVRNQIKAHNAAKQRWHSTLLLTLACVGIVAVVVEEEVRYHRIVLQFGDTVHPATVSKPIHGLLIFLHIIHSASTAGLLYVLWLYYQVKYDDWLLDRQFVQDEEFVGSPIFYSMLKEMFVCALHIPPGIFGSFETETVDLKIVTYSVRVLNLVAFLRLYLIFRWLKLHSRVRDDIARAVSSLYAMEDDRLLYLKYLLYNHAMVTISGFYLLTMVVFAYVILVFERPVDHQEAFYPQTTFLVAFWYVWVVMTTVGFGDWIPLSQTGRCASIVCSGFGLVLTALLISTVSTQLDVTKLEDKMLNTLNRFELRTSLPHRAATTIALWWRWLNNRQAYVRQYSKQVREWRRFRKEVTSFNSEETDAIPIIYDLQDQVKRILARVEVEPEDVVKQSASGILAEQLAVLAKNQQKTTEILERMEKRVRQSGVIHDTRADR